MTNAAPGDLDFDRMSEGYDRMLPHLVPVTEALLAEIDLGAGDLVVDLASGTGEVGLTVARRRPEVEVVGFDLAQSMVDIARRKVEVERLTNARFEQGDLAALEPMSAALVVSRFGVLQYGDLTEGAQTVKRLLRPGGALRLAVWADAALNTFAASGFQALQPELENAPAGPPVLDGPTYRAALEQAGLVSVTSASFSWTYLFDGVAEAWDLLSSPGVGRDFLAPLDAEARDRVRDRFSRLISTYQRDDGTIALPQTCLLLRGRSN